MSNKINELNQKLNDAESYLRRTYNILNGFDAEHPTSMDEVYGLILTAAFTIRKNMVKATLSKNDA